MPTQQIQTASLPVPEPRWKALLDLQSESGAIIIRQVDGGFIGWATGLTGDTNFTAMPGDAARIPEIRRAAVKMALAPVMLDACRLLVHGRRHLGAQVPQELADAVDLAVEVLSEMERLA